MLNCLLKLNNATFLRSICFSKTLINKQSNFVQIEEDSKRNGYIKLKLNKAPVNSMTLEFLNELNITLDKIEQAKDFNGVILTSVSIFYLIYRFK